MEKITQRAVAFGDVSPMPASPTTYVGYLIGTAQTKESVDKTTGEIVPAKTITVLYLKDKKGQYYATRSEGLTRQFSDLSAEELDSIPELTLQVKEKDLGGGRRVKRFVEVSL